LQTRRWRRARAERKERRRPTSTGGWGRQLPTPQRVAPLPGRPACGAGCADSAAAAAGGQPKWPPPSSAGRSSRRTRADAAHPAAAVNRIGSDVGCAAYSTTAELDTGRSHCSGSSQRQAAAQAARAAAHRKPAFVVAQRAPSVLAAPNQDWAELPPTSKSPQPCQRGLKVRRQVAHRLQAASLAPWGKAHPSMHT
jgi:hypothetical protein